MVLGGFVLVMVARDWGNGLGAVRRAVERNPGSGFVVKAKTSSDSECLVSW
jgi:hypothetical protein